MWAASCWIGSGLTKLGQKPHLSNKGSGIHKCSKIGNIYAWFRQLSERLRYVRVVCGDWTRVCGGNWQDNFGLCGIFFDPPYGIKDRNTKIYHHDSTIIANDVMQWAKERGKKKIYRIVIAGYEEHRKLLENGWTSLNWKSGGGYSTLGSQHNKNRFRETLYFLPYCLSQKIPKQMSLDFNKR